MPFGISCRSNTAHSMSSRNFLCFCQLAFSEWVKRDNAFFFPKKLLGIEMLKRFFCCESFRVDGWTSLVVCCLRSSCDRPRAHICTKQVPLMLVCSDTSFLLISYCACFHQTTVYLLDCQLVKYCKFPIRSWSLKLSVIILLASLRKLIFLDGEEIDFILEHGHVCFHRFEIFSSWLV